jgi:hypothetical protein
MNNSIRTFERRFVLSYDDPVRNSGFTYCKNDVESILVNAPDEIFGSFIDVAFQIDLDKVVIRAYNLRLDGNVLVCDFDILNTPYGFMMYNMAKDGHSFSLSPRCSGIVDDALNVWDCELLTIDVRMAND